MNFESRNPATGELLNIYPEHDQAETNARLQRAWDGWRRWSRTPLRERAAFLVRLAGLLEERAETYGRLITAEMASRFLTLSAKSRNRRWTPATTRRRGRPISSHNRSPVCRRRLFMNR